MNDSVARKHAIADAFCELPDVEGAAYIDEGVLSGVDFYEHPCIRFDYGARCAYMVLAKSLLEEAAPEEIAAAYADAVAQRIEIDTWSAA